MIKLFIFLIAIFAVCPPMCIEAQGNKFQKDIIKTSLGNLEITFIGHGTLMFSCDNKIIHVDPWTRFTDYKEMPRADIILITHEHMDHFDKKAIAALRKDSTEIVLNEACSKQLDGGIIMKNGDMKKIAGFEIEAVPAYNIEKPFHPRGNGNGYIITFGDKKIYVAGDTENIPEMKSLNNIYIAFLPMNLPFTMTPEMVADAAKTFKPEILYPYHYGETDTSKLVNLLKDEKDIEVRIRDMK